MRRIVPFERVNVTKARDEDVGEAGNVEAC